MQPAGSRFIYRLFWVMLRRCGNAEGVVRAGAQREGVMDRAERRRQQRLAEKQGARTQSIAPADAMALAETYRCQGRLAEAYALYQRVLIAYPQHALDRCGLVALQLGRTEEAIRHLRLAVASKHDFASAHNDLAIALGAAGHVDEALASCRRAIRFRPDLVESHVNLGHLLKRKGELEEAARRWWLRRAHRARPAKVKHDLDEGWITREAAEQVYGVVFGANGSVDATATETRRAALAAASQG